MVKIQSILAATDFSPTARHAVHRAAILAATLSISKSAVLHVLEESWLDLLKQFAGISIEVEQGIIDETMRSLGELAWDIRKKTNFFLEPQVRIGNILNTIAHAFSDFDLFVLGARGQHPVRSLALGTTSQRLLGKIRKPVLVVKQEPTRPYQHLLVAVDFSPNSARALGYSKTIAPEALISVVHVFEPLFEKKMVYAGASDELVEQYRVKARIDAESHMTEFIRAVGMESVSLSRVIEYGHAPDKLPKIAEKLTPDLIIVGKHGRSRIEEFLLGSVTLHMLSESVCDVLVVE